MNLCDLIVRDAAHQNQEETTAGKYSRVTILLMQFVLHRYPIWVSSHQNTTQFFVKALILYCLLYVISIYYHLNFTTSVVSLVLAKRIPWWGMCFGHWVYNTKVCALGTGFTTEMVKFVLLVSVSAFLIGQIPTKFNTIQWAYFAREPT